MYQKVFDNGHHDVYDVKNISTRNIPIIDKTKKLEKSEHYDGNRLILPDIKITSKIKIRDKTALVMLGNGKRKVNKLNFLSLLTYLDF